MSPRVCGDCDVSTYFNAALNGNFKEAWEQTVEMPEEEVDVFKHFQYWLYSKSIVMTDQSENDIDWRILIDLFILGEARLVRPVAINPRAHPPNLPPPYSLSQIL